MTDTRTFTFQDVRLISMFARMEGAPATAEQIVADLDAKGRLSGSPASRETRASSEEDQ